MVIARGGGSQKSAQFPKTVTYYLNGPKRTFETKSKNLIVDQLKNLDLIKSNLKFLKF
jgi:hypothetical protein